jgi:hemerythrin
MINIEWNPSYSVGHERIDHEHRVFIDLIKNVSIAADQKQPKEKVLRLLEEVKKYADFHFFSEQNIMLDANYEGYAIHKEEHRMLLASLDDQIYNFRIDTKPLDDVVDFLFQWFALHTTSSDKKLAKHIKENP